jgi:hypothetical protein
MHYEFQSIEFFRKIRDEQSNLLMEKTSDEIIEFFSSFHLQSHVDQTVSSVGCDSETIDKTSRLPRSQQ